MRTLVSLVLSSTILGSLAVGCTPSAAVSTPIAPRVAYGAATPIDSTTDPDSATYHGDRRAEPSKLVALPVPYGGATLAAPTHKTALGRHVQ